MNILKKPLLTVIALCVVAFVLLIGWQIRVQLKDNSSFFFQLRQIFFPSQYSAGQMTNLQQDLARVEDHAIHEDRGRDYASAGDYEKSIEEYKKSIEIIQKDPGYQGRFQGTKEELDRVNEEVRIDTQKFARHRLVEVYKKAGRYPEALEQIDWLLAHKPLDHIKQELLAKKTKFSRK